MKLFIDRFEGDWAVIVGDKISFNFPRFLLPRDAKEGDIIKVEIGVDKTSTEEFRKEIKNIIKGLNEKEGDISL
ncbi:MAG: DUF3006 domain-containing protein [bacterium]